jgi:hypothetical protein
LNTIWKEINFHRGLVDKLLANNKKIFDNNNKVEVVPLLETV